AVGVDVIAVQPQICDVPAGFAPGRAEVLFGDTHGGGQATAAGWEAEESEKSVAPGGAMEGGGVGMAGVLIEAVVAGAVEHAVEAAFETGQAGGVGHGEFDLHTPPPCTLAGVLDGRGSSVDAGPPMALTGPVDGLIA